ncbi:hypothetical protein RRV45_11335 [Bacillus sp. DTU_2020_1000418_1_SI_GHA_SEK_038]|uniref:hypothetical protein n=1 Tax=Bacillus sp. DTU_2020_1000418_1_SI_GHA_SEK_038 TaxID=3077585 RepID=UPI0028EE89FF|nr:hypothetical protein [Bacillus sp. DTU_2020_1000418_1_SI_GHA_SEK_038]WNS73520.1 hypothetical protein RRV45_11335 [Bacillus sp. DTU_2020_1000418_1_SI_GHA_SEK_038]
MYEQIYLIEKLEQYKAEDLKKIPYFVYEKRNSRMKIKLCRLPVINQLPKCQCT